MRSIISRKPGSCVLIFLLFGSATVFGQAKDYRFSKGLMATVPARYGREALYSDLLAYQMYTDSLKTPVAGGVLGKNDSGQDVNWMEVNADSLGRLRPAGRAGGGFGPRGGTAYVYLTYPADKVVTAILNIKGNAGVFVNGAIHMGDAYTSGWLYLPVNLKKGLNEFYVRGQVANATLYFPAKALSINTEDPTLPSILPGSSSSDLRGAITVINTSGKVISGATIESNILGKMKAKNVPDIPAFAARKIIFDLDPSGVNTPGKISCSLVLKSQGKVIDTASVTLDAVQPGDKYSVTFISDIDGSLQYYAVTPKTGADEKGAALFLSVHGAGVEAIGQARAYHSKDWGNLVAATNRRPRGFNWEDWGRIDALEVLELAKKKFLPDPQHIFLTGHSMGGHGTWFLGATYPDKWAAIGACSGYPTLKGYGSADGLIPDSSSSPMEQMLLRSSNQSDVIKLANNYKPLGVYVLHGDADKTVSVNYARQMRKVLAEFHNDMSYHEVVGGEHWFGDGSVDWKPLFEFFKWHSLPVDTAVNTIDFVTANPGISSRYFWASIEQQEHPLQYSRIELVRDKVKGSVTGKTTNVARLSIAVKDFKGRDTLNFHLDGSTYLAVVHAKATDTIYFEKRNGAWNIAATISAGKNPQRYGTFKDAFNHHMVFVYGTTGNKEENKWSYEKAIFDAETWYYRGNGAIDIIADNQYSTDKYLDRGVILFGNSTTNSAWNKLLSDAPIKMERGRISAGDQSWTGDDLAAYYVWPIAGSKTASVAVIGGTGLKGMKAANANQYFAGASGFPDFMIFSLDMLKSGSAGVKLTGFFDNQWRLSEGETVVAAENTFLQKK